MLKMVSITMRKNGVREEYMNAMAVSDGSYRILNGGVGLSQMDLISEVHNRLTASKLAGYENRVELSFSGASMTTDVETSLAAIDLTNVDILNINIRRTSEAGV